MSATPTGHHGDRAAHRRAERELEARRRRRAQRPSFLERWALPLVVAVTFAALTAAVLIARPSSGTSGAAAGGGRAPDFSALDVVSGKTMSLADLQGSKTLLFFSEGASCQACLMQSADLQRNPALRKVGINLVSVTTDPPDVLASVAKQYGITTPMLSDSSAEMSRAYGMLGNGGMGHPDQDGHAFMLLDSRGRILWEQAYTSMYVKPAELLAAMPMGS